MEARWYRKAGLGYRSGIVEEPRPSLDVGRWGNSSFPISSRKLFRVNSSKEVYNGETGNRDNPDLGWGRSGGLVASTYFCITSLVSRDI